MGTAYQEQFTDTPLPDIISAYLYQEYADDENIQAFVTAFNQLAQGYHDWFLNTPLPVWTNAAISGSLLDFIGTNLYGTERPVISTVGASRSFGAMNAQVMDFQAMGNYSATHSGTAQSASDDLYKRTLTWILYKGDGYQASIEWLRRRIARFLYGANGTDIDVGLLPNVSIDNTKRATTGAYNTVAWNTFAWNSDKTKTFNIRGSVNIKIPNLTVSQYFIDLFNGGYLPAPIQVKYLITIA